MKPEWTFIICHGLGGMEPGDRFEHLGAEIKRRIPDANVLLVDWTPTATQTNAFGLPQVWKTARQINTVAADAARSLAELRIDPRRTTLIGESFGAYVAGRIGIALGGVEHLLAFNPANEAGGYAPLDLRLAARQTWSFHTYSVYDTTQEIAHADFFLETPAGADPTAQHTYGIVWLAERIASGDLLWLRLEKTVPTAKLNAFRGEAHLDGRLEDTTIARQRSNPAA
jgi:pimeloyl-ACP methyl ester carboxylesterase